MVQPELPEELLDLFIDELQGDMKHGTPDQSSKVSSQSALQSCLLVSRSFCHRARRHLFSSIFLAHTTRKTLPQNMFKLMQILHSKLPIGGVARYIKKVTICLALGLPPTGPVDESVDSSLVNFLRSMIGDDYGIRDLTLIIVRRGGQRWLEWDRMSLNLQKSLTDTVQSAHLTNAHFLHISCIPRSVFANSHLKHLQLKGGGWKPSQRFVQAQHSRIILPPTSNLAPQLQSFRTDHSYPIKYFEPELDSNVSLPESPFSHLSTLASSVLAPQDFLDCTKILDRAARTLKDLHITFSLQIYEPPKSLDFELFPKLHDLEILYLGGALFGRFEDGIRHIFRLLDCPSTSNKLSSIRFIVKMSGVYDYPRDGPFSPTGSTTPTDWQALDSLLSGPKYASIQTLLFLFRVEFIDRPVIPNDTFITEAVDRFKRVFPNAVKSRPLKIIVEVG